MKRTLIFILFIAIISAIFAQISQINSFANETLYKDFDEHNRTVLSYGDRLIVQNRNKIEEYAMLEGGQLSKLSFVERQNNSCAFIDGDRYYNVRNSDYTQNAKFVIDVYDLSVSPMSYITGFNTIISPFTVLRVLFSERHVMVTGHNSEVPEFMPMLYEKNNYQLDGYLQMPDNSQLLAKKDDIIIFNRNQ
jgi:hypothetical protein